MAAPPIIAVTGSAEAATPKQALEQPNPSITITTDPPAADEKPRLQKRHTVTLAMSKSTERLSGLTQKKVMIRYGVYGLQGKRDAMEDAHVAVPVCPPTKPSGSPSGSAVTPPAGQTPAPAAPSIVAPPADGQATSSAPTHTTAPTSAAAPKAAGSSDRKPREKKEKKRREKKEKEKKEKKDKAATAEKDKGRKKGRKGKSSSRHREVPPAQEKTPIASFFGVYDGHGGKKASDFTAQTLYPLILGLSNTEPSLESAVVKAFAKTEEDFLALAAKDQWSDGTTAVIAIVDDKNKLLVANIGDSEAVICRKGEHRLLTHPHNVAKSKAEAERVVSAGGKIWNQRVAHPSMNPRMFSIAVSRSIGDLIYKNEGYTKGKVSGLISTPEIVHVDLTSDDQFLLLACDGLFDVITYKDAVDFILQHLAENNNDPEVVAKLLVECAFNKGSLDNITALLVTFNMPSK